MSVGLLFDGAPDGMYGMFGAYGTTTRVVSGTGGRARDEHSFFVSVAVIGEILTRI